jgi:hypothetical protein
MDPLLTTQPNTPATEASSSQAPSDSALPTLDLNKLEATKADDLKRDTKTVMFKEEKGAKSESNDGNNSGDDLDDMQFGLSEKSDQMEAGPAGNKKMMRKSSIRRPSVMRAT